MAGFPKGRRIPLVEGGVNAPPENAGVQGAEGHFAASFLLPKYIKNFMYFWIEIENDL